MPLVTSNQYQLMPNTLGAISQGYNLGQTMRGKFNTQQAQNRQLGQQQAQQQFLQGGGMSQPNALQEAGKLGLDFQKKVAGGLGLINQETGRIDERKLYEAAKFSLQTEKLPEPKQNELISQRANALEQAGDIQGANQIRELLTLPVDERKQVFETLKIAALSPEQIGQVLMRQQGGGQAASAGQREYESLVRTAQNPNASELEREAARVKLRIAPPATGSAIQTIAGSGTAEQIAQTEQTIARGKETGKSEAQLKFKPEIQRAVKLAESEASGKGDAQIDLAKRKAALTGVEEVVGQLKALADEATFTLAGKGFNEVAKQFGYSTEGGTARSSMVSIVDNQVLPLLKPIFGAAFTAVEGDRLRDAFLDPDSTPESRKATLDAFLNQTKRNIESLENELTQGQNQAQPVTMQAIDDATGEPVTFTLVNGQWVRR